MTHRVVISTDGTDFVISHPAQGGGETKVTIARLEDALNYVAGQLGKDKRDVVQIVRYWWRAKLDDRQTVEPPK